MSTQPLLSVIVPVYNVEQYLHQCVDSIIGQTYKNLEIILVNDGSTDGSGAICDEYATKDSRVRVIHKENGGLSSARNIAMEVMKGDFVSFVDSDDWLDLGAYETLVECLLDTGADVIQFGYVDEYEGQNNVIQDTPSPLKLVPSSHSFRAYALGILYPMMCTYVYKVASLSGLKCQIGMIHEDQLFNLEYFASHPKIVAILREKYYHYRRRSGSITSSKRARSIIDLSDGFRLVLDSLSKKNLAKQVMDLSNYIVLNRLEMHYMDCISSDVSFDSFKISLNRVLQDTYFFSLPLDMPRVIEYRAFRAYPKIYPYWARIYQPIARRLGVKFETRDIDVLI